MAWRPGGKSRHAVTDSAGSEVVHGNAMRGSHAKTGERRIAGQVVNADGSPVPGAQVTVGRRGARARGGQRAVVSDGNGRFDAGDFDRAEFLVTATLLGRPDARLAVDLRDPSVVSDDLRLTMPDCRSQLVGFVYDAAGGPIAGARIAEREAWGVTVGVESAADGSYALCTRDHDVLFQVTASGYGSLELTRVVRGRVRHDLVLVPEGVIEGQVVDRHGQPVEAEIEARVRGRDAERPAPRQVHTDPGGGFRLDGLAEWRWVVDAHNARGRSRDSGEILVRAGQAVVGVTLVLDDCHELAGTVTLDGEPLIGAEVLAFSLATNTVSPGVPSSVEGGFVLPCVPPGAARIWVDGYEVTSPRSVVHASDARPVAVTVAAMGRIRGRVLHAGLPVPGAVVSYAGGNRPPGTVRTDARGEYQVNNLMASTYRLSAAVGAARAAETSITLTAREQAQLDLTVIAMAALTGTVTTADGRPVPNARVVVARDDGKDDGVGNADGAGRFEIGGLDGDGNYTVAAVALAATQLPILNRPSAWLVAGATADVAVQVTVQQDAIAGRVVDARGGPVADAAVAAVAASGSSPRFVPWLPGSQTTTDADGTFRFEALPRGTYALRAATATGAEGVAAGVATPAERVQIVVQAGGSIAGTLEGFAVTPQIVAKRVDESVDSSTRGFVDGKSFRVDGLAPGRYLVTAQSMSDAAAATVQVTAGDQTSVTLRSGGHGTVRGHVREYGMPRGVAGETCNLVVRDGDLIGPPVPATLVDVEDDGGFVFRDAPAGDMVISCVGNAGVYSAGVRPVKLPPGGDVEVEVLVVKCDAPAALGLRLDLRRITPVVWMVDSGSPAEEAGVQVGDEVASIDGTSVDGLAPHAVLCAAINRASGQRVRLGLRRGGAKVERTIEVP